MRLIFISAALIVFICSSAVSAADPTFGEHNNEATSVSLIQLIANPVQWHRKIVHIPGVLVIEFEGDAIYLSDQDAKNRITKNAVWANIDYEKFGIPNEEPRDPKEYDRAMEKIAWLKKINGKYVYIEGVFNKDSLGHLGLYSGTVDVTRIYPME